VAASPEPAALEAVGPQAPEGPQAARGRRILARIAHDQGAQLASPAALWGYESVRVVLDALRAAQRDGGPADRADVIRAALRPRVRRSPIGTYQVRRNGAVEGLPMALYRLQGDRFEYLRTLF
jgi:ABC-type branched-subunit amino acid transport system substrate-binding protein